MKAARDAIGPDARLFVDANGAYSRKQALDLAERFADVARVSWFEEPVSSEDLEGLRLLRDRAPAGMEIAAGEYGDDAPYFRRMLEAGAVDVLQADVTRCGGITELLRGRRAVPRPQPAALAALRPRRSTCTPPPRSSSSSTSSTSTTTSGSSTCCSTGWSSPRTALWCPISTARESGWSSSAPDAERYAA